MIRKASITDPPAIAAIVNDFASREQMLPRALSEIYEALRDFYVCEEDGKIVGCAALHIAWEGLGEVRSLAVARDQQGKGIGTQLIEVCLREARELGIRRVFVLTYSPAFFRRFGFRDYPKENLPHKIWTDCIKCPKFPNCDEEALVLDFADGTPEQNSQPAR